MTDWPLVVRLMAYLLILFGGVAVLLAMATYAYDILYKRFVERTDRDDR